MTFLTPTIRERLLSRAGTTGSATILAERTPKPVVTIRPARPTDFPQMLAIFRRVCATGDSYVFSPDTPVRQVYDYWFGRDVEATCVAVVNGHVIGMYRLIANQKGRGSHVANVSIMVDPDARRDGIGLALGRHFVAQARAVGFLAIQANIVVSTNDAILALARKLGFAKVGRLPRAFRHRKFGLVDAYVMYLAL
jgi:L-amino acid N-acyltransferase YncA